MIRKTIDLPFSIEPSEYDYWRLQFKLKWEKEYHHPQKMKPLVDKLAWAFQKLGFKQPENEAKLLSMILDIISIGILREGKESQIDMQFFLKEKYKL